MNEIGSGVQTPEGQAQLRAKERAASELANGPGSAIGSYPRGEDCAVNSYNPAAMKEHEERHQKRRDAEMASQTRYAAFAEILRARPDLTPEQAADATLAVCQKLGA